MIFSAILCVINISHTSYLNHNYCIAHAKQSTIVLRWKNNAQVQYFYMECDDSDGIATYNYQNWPGENQPAGVIDRIHSLDEHYERRIAEVPPSTRGPLLEYASVSKCGYNYRENDVVTCLRKYNQQMNGLSGIYAYGWEMLAFMNHVHDNGIFGEDNDVA